MKIPDDLKRFNLVGPAKPARRRLVMTGEGGPGTGKTDFFYRTFPKPQLVIQLDMNDEGIRERYEGEDVLIKEIIVPPFVGKHTEDQRVKDMVIAKEVRELFTISMDKDYFRSIMIDEGEALYELARRAMLVDLDFGGESQQSYSPVNAYMKRFFTLAKQHRVNLYIPHKQKEERKEGFNERTQKKTSSTTGKMVYAGWKHAIYDSQCHVVFAKDDKLQDVDKFSMTIKKCTANSLLEGESLVGDDITLSNLGQLIWPLSDEGDWQ